MSKAGERIIQGMREALAYLNGDESNVKVHKATVPDLDVASVREKTKLSQEMFAKVFHIPLGTLRGWEQKVRKPDGATRVLLTLIDRDPIGVLKMLGAGNRKPAAKARRAGRRAAA